MATAPRASISGEEMDCTATERILAVRRRSPARRKRFISQCSIPKALTMPLPMIVSCTMFWISASLSWPRRVVLRTPRPTRRVEETMMGTKMSSTQAMRPPTMMTAPIIKRRVNICCRQSLMTPAMADWTRSTSLMSVEMSVPEVWRWKKAVERLRIESYRSLRRSVTMPKPALLASNVPR